MVEKEVRWTPESGGQRKLLSMGGLGKGEIVGARNCCSRFALEAIRGKKQLAHIAEEATLYSIAENADVPVSVLLYHSAKPSRGARA